MNKLIGEGLQRIRRAASRRHEVDREAILQAVPSIVIAVDQDGVIVFVNNAAEHFLQHRRSHADHADTRRHVEAQHAPDQPELRVFHAVFTCT